jgi:hypothetical protein
VKVREAEENLQQEQARATKLRKQIVRQSSCAAVLSVTLQVLH